jgi:signal transduction histidine kinase
VALNPVDEQAAREPVAGAWSLDVNAWLVAWSARARQIHDFSPRYPIGVWEALAFIDLQDRLRVFVSAMDCLRSGVPIGLEVGLTTAAGRRKRVRLSGFRASGDALPMLKGTIHELPHGKFDESRDGAPTQLLLGIVREWEIFGHAIPHELASPLSIARGFAQALHERTEGILDDAAQAHLARLLKALDQLQALLDSLLQFAPVAVRPMQHVPVNLSQLAQETIGLLQARDAARTVQVEIHEDLVAWGDPGLLRLLVSNLMANAWKFTRHRADATIRFAAREARGGAVYCVADNGVGFDRYDAARLFTPFVRLHERHRFDGSGVGLAVVRRVVERHGGTVWAEAAPDAGASFFFTLGPRTGA